MGFSEGVQWWEEWQLRLLVLASLFIQYLLFLGALLRKGRIPSWFRSLIWLAYHCCDLVVIYALATLFNQSNRMEELAMNHGSSTHLGALWASILLLHLGGQDGITAYSIEDNENWRRQFLIAVSQITVVIYVLRKSWCSDDVKLLRAAIVLFVPGMVKCLEKPWALKKATMASIMSSPDSRMQTTLQTDNTLTKDKIGSLDKYLEEAADMVDDWTKKTLAKLLDVDEAADHDKGADEPYHLFVDVGHPYIIRLRNLQLMLPRGARNGVHALVRSSLSKAFDRFYTKLRSTGRLRLLGAAVVVVLPFVGVGLFQQSRRDAYDRADVVVTYVVLCSTAALEFISACFALASGLQPSLDDQVAQYNLIGHLVRNNEHQGLVRLADRLGCKGLQLDRLWRMELPEPSSIITKLVYDHVVHGWTDYVQPKDEIVFDPVNDGMDSCPWKWYEKTVVGAYRRFNDSRGQRALGSVVKGKGYDTGTAALWSSLRVPFDESLLLWHLATELCYFEHADTGSDAIHYSRVISNYMAYLLLVNPDMLMPGARRSLVAAARHELQTSSEHRIELEPTETKLAASQPMSMDEVARRIIRNVKGTIDVGPNGLVHRAWVLAHELMEFAKEKADEEYERQKQKREEEMEKKMKEYEKQKEKRRETRKNKEENEMDRKQVEEDEEKKKKREEEERKRAEEHKRRMEEETKKKLLFQAKTAGDDMMWKVIQGVWVEMLCFSAGRCRGYLHAKSLGSGGEYLSYVWLLLSYMGMETMPEIIQRPELPVEGDTGALVEHRQDDMALKTDDTENPKSRNVSKDDTTKGQAAQERPKTLNVNNDDTTTGQAQERQDERAALKADDTVNPKTRNVIEDDDTTTGQAQEPVTSTEHNTKAANLLVTSSAATTSATAVNPIVGDDNV